MEIVYLFLSMEHAKGATIETRALPSSSREIEHFQTALHRSIGCTEAYVWTVRWDANSNRANPSAHYAMENWRSQTEGGFTLFRNHCRLFVDSYHGRYGRASTFLHCDSIVVGGTVSLRRASPDPPRRHGCASSWTPFLPPPLIGEDSRGLRPPMAGP